VLNRWQDWVGTFTGVVALTVVALPVAAVVMWVLAHRRSANGAEQAWRRSVAEVGMVYGTVPCVWMILLPGEEPGVVRGTLTLVPLRDLLEMNTGQIVGNLLVFAALGFFAPLRFAALASVPRILALAASVSALLEIAQYLWLDRVSSVDDVLLNAAGAGLAAMASRHWWRARSDMPVLAPAA
jgi:glycopeptide antibiotics resistance protein